MMRILSGAAAEARVKRIAARGSRYAEVEPAVRRIIDDVRRHGDRAVRKYAERWDGLLPGTPLPVFEQEIEAAWKSASPELEGFLASRGGQYPPLLRMAKAERSGSARGRESPSDKSCGPWIPWAVTFRAGVTRWSPPCS